MTKNEIIALFKALNSTGNLRGVRFAYAVNKNINLLKPEVEAIEKSLVSDEKFDKYDKERIELAKKYAVKEENGNPKTKVSEQDPNQQEFVMEDLNGFKNALRELQVTHKDAIEGREKYLEENVEIAFFPYRVKLEDVPFDISTAQMSSIFAIISED